MRPGVTSEPGDIDHAVVGRRRRAAARGHIRDPLAIDDDVANGIDAGRRVDQPSTLRRWILVTPAIVHTSKGPHDHLRRSRCPDAHQRARLRARSPAGP